MDNDVSSVFPETRSSIEHARSLELQPWSTVMTPYASVGALLTRQSETYSERIWLTSETESAETVRLTFGEFTEQVRRAAGFMANSLGIKQGDRVATLMTNDLRTVIVYFGAWFLGATVVPINIAEDDERIAYILINAAPRALFAFPEQMRRVLSLRHENDSCYRAIVQVGGEQAADCLDFETGLSGAPPHCDVPDVTPDTPALIIYTSGTTGPPKGVVLDHANLLADAHSIAEWHRFTDRDHAMCVLPIHHVNGIVVTLLTPLYSGGRVTLCRHFRTQTFWSTLAHERCTWVSVVPTVLAFLCERHEDLSQYDLSLLRHIICGAGPLTVELARRFDAAFGVRVVHGYGLSETTCYSCFLPIDLDRTAYSRWMFQSGFPSIGCPISANEMAIHDVEGLQQPPGVRGEIVIRGHNVMRFYFQRPDANRDTFAHGWFRSGDEGYVETGEDGRSYYFITGRLKELIIRGGVNYSPFDIDEALSAIKGVRAGMAVGFDNDFYGEEVGAYVQLEDGVQLTEADIVAACRSRLSFNKSPKVVMFGDTFPVTSTGKYQRTKLKPLFARWKSVQFRER